MAPSLRPRVLLGPQSSRSTSLCSAGALLPLTNLAQHWPQYAKAGWGWGTTGGGPAPNNKAKHLVLSVWCTGGLPGGVREERTVGGKQESQPRGRDTGPVNCLVFPRRGTQRGMSKHTSEALRLCIYLTIACTRLKALGPGVGVGGGAQRASACCQARCRRALWFDLGRPLSLS